MGARILVGTSGFSYPSWRGAFYPQDLPASRFLPYYAEHFATVEINNTFHRMPTEKLLAGWAAQVPEEFRFALKAPQRITHQLRLRDAAEPAGRFCALAATLGARLGPLLFQLPPTLRADVPRLADFLAGLPAGAEVAFEFRHPSWLADATWAALAARGAALCVADGEALAAPVVATAPFGYLRLRRETYADADLDAWAERIATTPRWERVYVYFKHDDAGQAAAYARALLDRLGAAQ